VETIEPTPAAAAEKKTAAELADARQQVDNGLRRRKRFQVVWEEAVEEPADTGLRRRMVCPPARQVVTEVVEEQPDDGSRSRLAHATRERAMEAVEARTSRLPRAPEDGLARPDT
jgi:hypothetical protein